MRPTRGAVLWGPVVIALAGCGTGSHQPPRRPHHPPVRSASSGVRTVAPKGAQPPQAKPTVTLLALQRALTRELATAGPHTGALVYDITARSMLFALRGAIARAPASVEKLYTSVAVLTELGAGTRLQTAVLGAGQPRPGGLWHGNLYLRGDGDPTFGDGTFNRIWEEGYGPTAQDLAGQIRRAGIRRVTGWVIGDGSVFDSRRGGPATGFAPDVPDLGGQLSGLTYDHGSTLRRLSPEAFAARELALALRANGVSARAADGTSATPATARPLASVSSPPASVLVRLTDIPSDDFFAEMLTKQLGARFGSGGSTAAGAGVISHVLAQFQLRPRILDGSGLSRQDRTSPEQVIALLRDLWGTATGRLLLAALPVVGVSGTVRRLAVHTPAEGRCAAKTGTLDNVTNLAGYCQSRAHHVLAFALFLDGPPNSRGMVLLGRMVAAIARY